MDRDPSFDVLKKRGVPETRAIEVRFREQRSELRVSLRMDCKLARHHCRLTGIPAIVYGGARHCVAAPRLDGVKLRLIVQKGSQEH
jgi:hypothetical protein